MAPTPASAASPGPVPTPASSAAPPLIARVLAVAAILVAGLCGGLIGYAVTDLSCADECATQAGIVGLVSAIGCALGVAIVAVLALRAMAEWNANEARARAHTTQPTSTQPPTDMPLGDTE